MTMLVYIVVGLVLLYFGGEALVRGSVQLAKTLGVSTLVIGLTVVAFGTSFPELMVSIQAAIDNHPDLVLGNIIGSNVSNILLIAGIAALLTPILAADKVLFRDGSTLLVASALLIALSYSGYQISMLEGLGLLTILLIHTLMMFKTAGAETIDVEDEGFPFKASIDMDMLLIGSGLLLLYFGAELLIHGAVDLARYFSVSEAVIGLTMVALGTSIPELVTTLISVKHKNIDIILGNVLGSNIFNILMVLGVTALIQPLAVTPELFKFSLWLMMGITLLMIFILRFREKLDAPVGVVFLGLYAFYLWALF
jgi:cation:H+ antiporter